jgi:pimeloyl-ACP methyl ester carboxylesterase/DNA-binding CsgD family transcriptional regulator
MTGSDQQIRLCKAPDGVAIAVANTGNGPPLLRAGHWPSHVEFDGHNSPWDHWVRELSREHSYVRYDLRGCGLSEDAPHSISFEAWISDLEAVADALGLQRFTLLGMAQGGAVATAYAARHPDRVSCLVLMGSYAQGTLACARTPQEREVAETLLKLVRVSWDRDNPAVRQFFTTMHIPGGTREQQQWFNELGRISATPENIAAIMETAEHIDVTGLAEKVRVPAIVFHSRNDGWVPFDEGRKLASLIPGANFVPLESDNHVLLKSEPAWPRFVGELRRFFAQHGMRSRSTLLFDGARLTQREHEVLTLLARGLNNRAIASALGKSEKTVRNQVSSIFSKLGVRTRVEAIVRARDEENS